LNRPMLTLIKLEACSRGKGSELTRKAADVNSDVVAEG
jgi:hypothetical protein